MSNGTRRERDHRGRDRVARRIAAVASLVATAAVAAPMTLSAIHGDGRHDSTEIIAASDPRFPAPLPTLDDDVELAMNPTPTTPAEPTPTPDPDASTTPEPSTPTPRPTAASETSRPTTAPPTSATARPTVPAGEPTVVPTIPTPIVLPPVPPTAPPTETPTATAEPTATMSAPSPVTPRPDDLEGSLELVSADHLSPGTEGQVRVRIGAEHLRPAGAVTVRVSLDGATLAGVVQQSSRWTCSSDTIGWACHNERVEGRMNTFFDLAVVPTQPGPISVVVVIEATGDGPTLRWRGAVSVVAEPAEQLPNSTPESDSGVTTTDLAAGGLEAL